MKTNFFVFDTNSLLSAFLIQSSVSAAAFDTAINKGRLVMSEPCLQEFSEVLFRAKFDPYFKNEEERIQVINRVENSALLFFPEEKIEASRDSRDNKFLELAIEAKAICIITGDKDLLVLHPFREISILSPSAFLEQYKS